MDDLKAVLEFALREINRIAGQSHESHTRKELDNLYEIIENQSQTHCPKTTQYGIPVDKISGYVPL